MYNICDMYNCIIILDLRMISGQSKTKAATIAYKLYSYLHTRVKMDIAGRCLKVLYISRSFLA